MASKYLIQATIIDDALRSGPDVSSAAQGGHVCHHGNQYCKAMPLPIPSLADEEKQRIMGNGSLESHRWQFCQYPVKVSSGDS